MEALGEYLNTIHEDFLRFAFDAHSFRIDAKTVVVTGELRALGRLTREPLVRTFEHRWLSSGDRVTQVEPARWPAPD
jgi:hypothetical protein